MFHRRGRKNLPSSGSLRANLVIRDTFPCDATRRCLTSTDPYKRLHRKSSALMKLLQRSARFVGDSLDHQIDGLLSSRATKERKGSPLSSRAMFKPIWNGLCKPRTRSRTGSNITPTWHFSRENMVPPCILNSPKICRTKMEISANPLDQREAYSFRDLAILGMMFLQSCIHARPVHLWVFSNSTLGLSFKMATCCIWSLMFLYKLHN